MSELTVDGDERKLFLVQPLSVKGLALLCAADPLSSEVQIAIMVRSSEGSDFPLMLDHAWCTGLGTFSLTGTVAEPVAAWAPQWLEPGIQVTGQISRFAGSLGTLSPVQA